MRHDRSVVSQSLQAATPPYASMAVMPCKGATVVGVAAIAASTAHKKTHTATAAADSRGCAERMSTRAT